MVLQGKQKVSKNESIYLFPAKILKYFICFMLGNVFLKYWSFTPILFRWML